MSAKDRRILDSRRVRGGVERGAGEGGKGGRWKGEGGRGGN